MAAVFRGSQLQRLEMHGRKMYAAFLRDISERKQAQRAIQLHEERLEAVKEIQQWMFPKVPVHRGLRYCRVSTQRMRQAAITTII